MTRLGKLLVVLVVIAAVGVGGGLAAIANSIGGEPSLRGQASDPHRYSTI
jgi:hypothetical protein